MKSTICFLLFAGVIYVLDFSLLASISIALFSIIHGYGAYFGYTKTPFGQKLAHMLHSERNQYDRLVHLVFGFLCGPLLFEVGEKTGLNYVWTFIFPVLAVLAISALFEIFEWLSLVFGKKESGTGPELQGDIWDTHKDMLLAFVGVLVFVFVKFIL